MELPPSYLVERTTFERAAAEHMHDGRPFGHAEDDRRRLLSKRSHGDELWSFAPPSPDVLQLWGVALVRQGRVISTVVTAVN